jgi:16S rRNA (cytosine1402-N4)-methyltransferase
VTVQADDNAADENQLHIPVLLDKTIELLNVRHGLTYIDVTAGAGGHLEAISNALAGTGLAIGIDKDLESVERLCEKFNGRTGVKVVHGDFARLSEVLAKLGISTVTGGIIADLGVSSMQIDDAQRGFSFLREGPLDMRMDKTKPYTAKELVNNLDETELSEIIFRYGEERYSRAIARKIVEMRPLSTTRELADLVVHTVKRKSGKGTFYNIHPATRTFQAIRIAVNSELENLSKFLEQAATIMAPGAMLVVISFHGLEDRIVKQFFKLMASPCICPPRFPICNCNKRPQFQIITRKPIVADEQEILANIRSRSAKLRSGEKILET